MNYSSQNPQKSYFQNCQFPYNDKMLFIIQQSKRKMSNQINQSNKFKEESQSVMQIIRGMFRQTAFSSNGTSDCMELIADSSETGNRSNMQQNIASIKYARIQFCIYSSLFNFVEGKIHRLFLTFITQAQLTDFWISVNSPATFVFSQMCLLRGKKKLYISKGTSKQHPFLQCRHYNKLPFFSSFVSLLFRKCVLKTDILVIPPTPTSTRSPVKSFPESWLHCFCRKIKAKT